MDRSTPVNPDMPGRKTAPGKSAPEKSVILVVDDDPANRRLMSGILELDGYQVHAKGSGEEAWEWIREHPRGFDLMVTDVRMPGMNGMELACLVRELRPEARILFVTGYSDYSPKQLVVSGDPRDHILQKPFENRALLLRVETLLKAP